MPGLWQILRTYKYTHVVQSFLRWLGSYIRGRHKISHDCIEDSGERHKAHVKLPSIIEFKSLSRGFANHVFSRGKMKTKGLSSCKDATIREADTARTTCPGMIRLSIYLDAVGT